MEGRRARRFDGRVKTRIDFKGLASTDAKTKYDCAKRLMLLARKKPSELYPHIDEFSRLLDHENRLIRWMAIDILGEVASVDRRGKVDKVLSRLIACLNQGEMITANHAISSLARIASSKPALVPRVAAELMKVRRFNYKSPECRNIALGNVALALGELAPTLKDSKPVLRFVREVSANSRPATRKKAERLLKRLGRSRR